MTEHYITWSGRKIPFAPGEMLAFTLVRSGARADGLGKSSTGQQYGLFCGIGACQGCLVRIAGRGVVESCLTPSADGMSVEPVWPDAGAVIAKTSGAGND